MATAATANSSSVSLNVTTALQYALIVQTDYHRRQAVLFSTRPSHSISQCSYGKTESRAILDANYITFHYMIGVISNPVVWRINSWPGSARLKIDIVDVDPGRDDDVDFLQTVLSLSPTNGLNKLRFTLENRVELSIEVHLYCGHNYYGLTCAEHCAPRNDSMGHYTCNTQTGSKICLTGWVGSECNTNEDNCIGNKCQNGGRCKDMINSYECVCPAGFVGNLCEQDVNECVNHDICDHGLCVNQPGFYICKCFPGYTGDTCSINTNDCLPSPCYNGSTCHDLVNDFLCSCPAGFTGKRCDEDINECQLSPCSNNGTCVNYAGGHQCDCLSGYHGNDCSLDVDECNHSPCKNEGVCTNLQGEYSCQCPAGFEGFHCDSDIDECENSNVTCHNGGSCINTPGNYTCQCVKGFAGQNCETNVNECLSGPCKHNATCHDLIGSYSCDCTQGYTGQNCEHNINECLDEVCKNGGTCTDLEGGFACACSAFWEGKTCEENINECLSHPCKNGGTCENVHEGFHCICPTEFIGSLCEADMNECELDNACQNNSTCTNSFGSFTCVCMEGWAGLRCEEDINECELDNTCQNNSTCINSFGSYTCVCMEGWAGLRCEEDINECELDNACQNNSTCTNSFGSYTCVWMEGWTGLRCEEDINECELDNACQNNSTCTNSFGSFTCVCMEGWAGLRCEEDINECELGHCYNLGTCVNTHGGFQCECPINWQGTRCQDDVNECAAPMLPCRNNATCHNILGAFHCECAEGWTEPLCDVDINECLQVPDICKTIGNNADPDNFTDYHTLCTNTKPGYNCTCEEGWTGPLCNEDINECVQSPNICETMGNFTEPQNSTDYHTLCSNTKPGYRCTCQEGWTGPLCNEDINECLRTPDICQPIDNVTVSHNSTDYHALCTNTKPGYNCTCEEGWTGPLCNEDINECIQSPDICIAEFIQTRTENASNYHTLCVNSKPGFVCMCQEGWMGELCDEDIDECLENSFLCSFLDNSTDNDTLPISSYHAVCVNTYPGFLCTCTEGWAGENCDKDIGTTTPTLDSASHYENDTVEIYDTTTHKTNGIGYSHKVSVSEVHTTEITREATLNAEISDVTEVYSGNSKHQVNEISTTNYTAVNMEENHNITRGKPDISIPFYLACTIEPSMEWTVNNGLKQMFLDSHLFERKELTISLRSQAETFKDGQTATSIHPTVTVNGKELSDQEISFVLNRESHKVQDYLHCPLFLDAVKQKVAFSSAQLSSSTTVWYPGLIIACACLVVAVILIVIVKSRRGRKTWFLHKFKAIKPELSPMKPELSPMKPVFVLASPVQDSEVETGFRKFWAMNDNELNSAAEYDVKYGQQEITG